jgi:hypothetical protein
MQEFQMTLFSFRHSSPAIAPLRFADADQPVLDMSWEACGADLSYDGTVDAADDTIASQLAVWRQEDPALPWYRQTGLLLKDVHEVKARLSGFTGYASTSDSRSAQRWPAR